MGTNGNKRKDWLEIQKYYNEGHSETEVTKKFGVASCTLHYAKKHGYFTSRSRSEGNKLNAKKNPRKHTQETKDKISKSRIKYLEENPDKVPYLLNHYSKGDSYPEKYFKKVFKNENIKLTEKYQIWLYQLDFADVKKKIDIEIDGEQHYVDLRIVKSDKRRTKYLTDRGWKVYRVRWSDYKKMSMNDKREIVNEIKELLK